MTLPIDPSMITSGPDWDIAGVQNIGQAQSPAEIEAGAGTDASSGIEGVSGAGSGSGFGDVLAKTLGQLQAGQDAAAQQAQALATGQSSDPTSVVMAVEKAQLQMQLASTLRNKATEAISDIFHTTV
jgi:flagellar hook-basal body complex protein FliE